MHIGALGIGSAVPNKVSGTDLLDIEERSQDRPMSQIIKGLVQIFLDDFRSLLVCCIQHRREAAHLVSMLSICRSEMPGR